MGKSCRSGVANLHAVAIDVVAGRTAGCCPSEGRVASARGGVQIGGRTDCTRRRFNTNDGALVLVEDTSAGSNTT